MLANATGGSGANRPNADGSSNGDGVVQALLRPASQTTYEKIFGTVYVGLMVNVLLAVACSPLLVALALVRNPLLSWPFFLALSCLCAPALAGAFRCFAALETEDGAVVLRPFWAGYRSAARRVLFVWAGGAVAVGVLVADAVLVARTDVGPALVPFFVTAVALVIAVVVGVVVMAVENPRAGLRELVRPCVYLLARRWYLAVANVAVLALLVGIVLLRPAIGVLVASAPLLYVVWANTRYAVNHPMIIGSAPTDSGVKSQ